MHNINVIIYIVPRNPKANKNIMNNLYNGFFNNLSLEKAIKIIGTIYRNISIIYSVRKFICVTYKLFNNVYLITYKQYTKKSNQCQLFIYFSYLLFHPS